jgi:hypothetical protein
VPVPGTATCVASLYQLLTQVESCLAVGALHVAATLQDLRPENVLLKPDMGAPLGGVAKVSKGGEVSLNRRTLFS